MVRRFDRATPGAGEMWGVLPGGACTGGIHPALETSPSNSGMNPVLACPPGKTMSRYESLIGTIGKIALRRGGCCAAVKSCEIAMYDPPHMPTMPLLHGCAAAHSTAS